LVKRGPGGPCINFIPHTGGNRFAAKVSVFSTSTASGATTPASGTHSLTFTLPGFKTIKHENIEFRTDFESAVNIDLRVGLLEETVTVAGETPMADVQSAYIYNKLQNHQTFLKQYCHGCHSEFGRVDNINTHNGLQSRRAKRADFAESIKWDGPYSGASDRYLFAGVCAADSTSSSSVCREIPVGYRRAGLARLHVDGSVGTPCFFHRLLNQLESLKTLLRMWVLERPLDAAAIMSIRRRSKSCADSRTARPQSRRLRSSQYA
jgi:hypothetical protein